MRNIAMIIKREGLSLVLLLAAGLFACNSYESATDNHNDDDDPQPPSYELVASFPHDPNAFTQGLIAEGEQFYESTGKYGQSTLRRVDRDSGTVLASLDLASDYFGEGLAVVGDRLYQLTWRESVCFVYAKSDFAALDTLSYEGEGWGLAYIAPNLVMSNGSSTLRYIDPDDFSVVSELEVRENGSTVPLLNELEIVDGMIYANILGVDDIVIIDPDTGVVQGRLYLYALRDALGGMGYGALNGIAYEEASQRLFVTGKNWPTLFEIQVSFGD